MRKFGYLESNPMTSEAIYHEDAIVAAIKNVQKYGALNETGIVDEKTLQVSVYFILKYIHVIYRMRNCIFFFKFFKLLAKPRCGVVDMPKKIHSRRAKRFVIGSSGWQKRRITYL